MQHRSADEVLTQFKQVQRWRHGHRPCLAYRTLLPSGDDEPHNTLVLLLHGLGDSGLCFARLLEMLPTRWQYVALDWRGHGSSEWLPDGISGYSLADHAIDLILFVKFLRSTLATAHIVIVAHSMATGIASAAVALGDLSIDALVYIENTGACGMYEGFFAQSQGLRISHAISVGLEAPPQRTFRSWAEASEWTATRHLKGVSPAGRPPTDVVENVLRAISETDAEGSIAMLSDPRIHATKDGFHLIPLEFERTEILPKFRCPLLFVHAEDGPCTERICNARGVPSLEDRMSDFSAPVHRYAVSAGGHYPHVHAETVSLVALRIERFIRDAVVAATPLARL